MQRARRRRSSSSCSATSTKRRLALESSARLRLPSATRSTGFGTRAGPSPASRDGASRFPMTPKAWCRSTCRRPRSSRPPCACSPRRSASCPDPAVIPTVRALCTRRIHMKATNLPPFRDRIVELRRVRAGDLKKHPQNWRLHSTRQTEALRALLGEIGYAAALIAREEDGELILIDGHLRRSLRADQIVPVLVLDVSADEAKVLLASMDPLASLATADPAALRDLVSQVGSSSE